MELLLNLVWLIGSLTALVIVIRRARGSSRPALMILATVCTIFLLFPIISVTDDLSPDREAIEESMSIRRAMSASTAHPLEQPAIAFVVSRPLALFSLTFLAFVENDVPASLTVLLTPQTTPRSPPRA